MTNTIIWTLVSEFDPQHETPQSMELSEEEMVVMVVLSTRTEKACIQKAAIHIHEWLIEESQTPEENIPTKGQIEKQLRVTHSFVIEFQRFTIRPVELFDE